MQKRLLIVAGALFSTAGVSSAAVLYSETFDTDQTANWTLNGGPSDEAADFFFDYSTVGIPLAPGGGSTRGMKLQANLANGIFSGMSVSPNGQSFAGDYTVKFDWWANANGPFPGGGSGSTNLSTYGIGTAGTTVQWPGGTQDSVWFGATGDGGSSVDYRAYSPAAGTGYTAPSGVFAAGTSTSPDSRNAADPYYASLGSNTPPAAQTALFPQQTGATGAGAPGMRWHEVQIIKQGNFVDWYLGTLRIATVDLTNPAVTLGGGNIFFGHSDINSTSSSDVNDAALLFTLIDNVVVVPEPASLGLLMLAVPMMIGRRRAR